MQVWDAHRGDLLKPFAGHDDEVTGLAFTRDGRSLATCSRDSTILDWDHAGMVGPVPAAPVQMLPGAWEDLVIKGAKLAHVAILSMSNSPNEALALLGERLKPEAGIDAKKLEECLKNLDHPSFQVRQKAKSDIEGFGHGARVHLERFAQETASVEARERVEAILKSHRKEVTDPERMRQIRAMEILERIGSGEANRIVDRLSKGAADGALTLDAKAVQLRRRR